MWKRLGQLGVSVARPACRQQKTMARFMSTESTVKEIYTPKKRKFGFGTALLCTIPFVTFGLGTWQVQRLRWKVNYIRTLEDRLYREPIPLPKRINPDMLEEYEYRKVYVKGHYRHDQEILLGPRTRGDGNVGYFVITPFERDNGTTILVKRGWISPEKKDKRTRPDSLVTDEVVVIGLIRVNEQASCLLWITA
ncbi:surf-like protein [Rhizopus stolonifer]|uniref:SURF1-like protein n=1 Tax=Rhizopus stolonifer TaxID=4846 RepID=A0A367J2W9_RHIST|nr:surf-like protein [Rhizopus stolonifer]